MLRRTVVEEPDEGEPESVEPIAVEPHHLHHAGQAPFAVHRAHFDTVTRKACGTALNSISRVQQCWQLQHDGITHWLQ